MFQLSRMNKKTIDFIKLHENNDVNRLALQTSLFADMDKQLVLRQIAGKQKIRAKVPFFYAIDELLYPQQLSLEQSSSESTAKYKSLLCEGDKLIDLTGGFGIDCFFMSKHFTETVYVERNEELCSIAQHNFNLFKEKNIQVVHADSINFLRNLTEKVSCIFIDPARRNENGGKVFRISDCEPNVESLHDELLVKSDKVIVKLSPMLDIDAALRALPSTSQIHILSVENECKELLFVLEKNGVTEPIIYAVNIGKNAVTDTFLFTLSEENKAESRYSAPARFLYEPNASLLKSGAFKAIGSRFGLSKLNKNTHLYTSEALVDDFQGRIFEIKQASGFSRQEIKALRAEYPKANISCRNFPLSVNELRKKTGIAEGGDIYMFACKDVEEQNVIIIGTKCN